MAGKRISEIPTTATSITGTELSALVQGGETKKFSWSIVLAYILGAATLTELIQDVVGAMVSNGGGLTWSYNDGAGTLGATVSITSSSVTDFSTAADARITAQKGVNSGLAPLDGGGKISTSYLPSSILNNMKYQGTWNANTNSPALVSSTGTQGFYYVVGTAGTTTIDGVSVWDVGDWIVFDGTIWDKIDNTDRVTSVNGSQGAVVLTTANISEVTNLYYTDERVDDRVAALLQNGGGITWTYNDGSGTLTPAISITVSQISDIATNYYNKTQTDAQYETVAVGINTQVADYTLVLADASKYIRMNKATAVNLTVPANSSVAFPVGTKIYPKQVGAGQVTIVADTGVTINTPETLLLKKQWAAGTLIKVGTNEWDLEGNLA